MLLLSALWCFVSDVVDCSVVDVEAVVVVCSVVDVSLCCCF